MSLIESLIVLYVLSMPLFFLHKYITKSVVKFGSRLKQQDNDVFKELVDGIIVSEDLKLEKYMYNPDMQRRMYKIIKKRKSSCITDEERRGFLTAVYVLFGAPVLIAIIAIIYDNL